MDDNWTVKVADFGLSRVRIATTMTATGTPQWSAPEVIRHERYTEKADVYSFGIIIFELLTGKIPYNNMSPVVALHNVAYMGLRPQFPSNSSPEYAELASVVRFYYFNYFLFQLFIHYYFVYNYL